VHAYTLWGHRRRRRRQNMVNTRVASTKGVYTIKWHPRGSGGGA